MSTCAISILINKDAQLEVSATNQDGVEFFDRCTFGRERTLNIASYVIARRLREGSLSKEMTLLEFALWQGGLTLTERMSDRDMTVAYEEET
jgi:hypothetical protein